MGDVGNCAGVTFRWPTGRQVTSRFRGHECYSDLSTTIRSRLRALAYIQLMRDNNLPGRNRALGPKTPGFTAVGIFLFFGAVMASLAATTLLWRGTALDRLWALNPNAYQELAPLGDIVGIFFFLLGADLITAGIGWFRRRLWGWRLAVVIISTQVLGMSLTASEATGCAAELA